MALSLGTLFVKLNADPSQLTQGLSQAATKIEQFGNRLKQTSEKLTQLGVAMSAAGVGAVAVAAQFDSGVKSSLDELKSTTAAISVEIGRSFIPAMETLNQILTVFGNMLRQMDPNTKQMMASFVALGGVVLLAAGAISKIVAVAMQLAPLFADAIAPAIAAVSAAFLPLLALLAAVIVLVPLIANEWTLFTTGMRANFRLASKAIFEAFESVKTYFFEVVNSIGQAWSRFTGELWSLFAKAMKKVGEYAGKVAAVFGLDWKYQLEAFNTTIDEMAADGFQPIVDMAKSAGEKAGAFLGESIEHAKNMIMPGIDIIIQKWQGGFQKIKDGAKSLFEGMFDKISVPSLGAGKTGTAATKAPAAQTPAQTMTLEAIDVYGRVGKKAAEVTATWQDGVKLAGENLLQGLGTFSQILSAATQGMEAGGPIGAAIGALTALVMQSASFKMAVESLNGFIMMLADLLGNILSPAFNVIGMVFKALTPIIQTLGKILGGPLFFALKGIALVVLGVVWVVGQVYNFIIEIVAWVFNAIGDALNFIWGGAGQGMKDAAAAMKSTMVDIAQVEKDMGEISRMTMDPATTAETGTKPIQTLGDAAKETADTLNELNASLTNIPAGFKIAAARFNAAAPAMYDFGLGGNMQQVEVNLNLDGKQIHNAIVIANARGQYIHRGGVVPSRWWGA